MNRLIRFFPALILLTMACVVPGLSTDAPQIAPTADTRLENMVALTVSAALTQTQQAVPTQTLVPTQTAEPTATSTSEADSAGSTLTKNDDGTFTFIDINGEYQITVPSELVPLRINEQEFLDAWLLPEASNPAMQNLLGSFQNQDPHHIRLVAIEFNEEHSSGGFVTNIYFLWDDAVDLSTEEKLVEAANEYLKAFPGAEIVESKAAVLRNETPVGLVTFKNSVTTLDGTEIFIIQKQAFLALPQGILAITLAASESQFEFIEPLFNEMLETFSLVDGALVN